VRLRPSEFIIGPAEGRTRWTGYGDEAIQGRLRQLLWIASRSLSSGRPLRAGPVGSQ
jgi:hypothetical protein